MPPPEKWILGCRMIRWRSTGEGSIYRAKRAGANLTYLFAASVKSEGVQVDMVTVRTVIKGFAGDLTASGHNFEDISLCKIAWLAHRQFSLTVILSMSA